MGTSRNISLFGRIDNAIAHVRCCSVGGVFYDSPLWARYNGRVPGGKFLMGTNAPKCTVMGKVPVEPSMWMRLK